MFNHLNHRLLNTKTPLQRREFLKCSSAALGGMLWQGWGWPFSQAISNWASPLLPPGSLLEQVLQLTPRLTLNRQGLLEIHLSNQHPASDGLGRQKASPAGLAGAVECRPMPVVPTLWNQEYSRPEDRLREDPAWGIVLHWYGDRDGAYDTLQSYINGFDGYRLVNPPAAYLPGQPKPPPNQLSGNASPLDGIAVEPAAAPRYRTSAHFLVGSAVPAPANGNQQALLNSRPGIVQTQRPDEDGHPFIAAHIGPMNYQDHTYFIDALEQIKRETPAGGVTLKDTILQDFYQHPSIPPNWRSLGIEICGNNFDTPQGMPGAQQLANVLGVICAVMKRYGILAHNIMGHHEIQLGKADPGKRFLALMRYLVGIKALVDGDSALQSLTFGPFSGTARVTRQSIQAYFEHLHKYLLLISNPLVVYQYEMLGGFWISYPRLNGLQANPEPATLWLPPLEGQMLVSGRTFLSPEDHPGLDLYPQALYERSGKAGASATARLIASGECLHATPKAGYHRAGMAVFRHTQEDGARILSIYENLTVLFDLQPGRTYPAGYPLGRIEKTSQFQSPFLHLGIACGALWNDGSDQPTALPLNAGSSWIRQRYLDPLEYLKERGLLG